MLFVFNLFYIIHEDQFKDLYDKIYTIGYYSGFYSSLRDKIWVNGDHFGLLSNHKEQWDYNNMCVQNPPSNHDHNHNKNVKQMVTPFNIPENI